MIVVQYADVGIGFSPHETGAATAPRRFWEAARELVSDGLGQPPVSIRTTGAHPIWGLRRLYVAGEAWWCFSVQGRGGRFGVAGTCRFGFLPGGEHPYDVWQVGVSRAAAGDPVTPPAAGAGRRRQIVADVLAGMAGRLSPLPIEADPSDAAEIIGTLLFALPGLVARQYVWSTCLFQQHDQPDVGVVAAPWPAAFRAGGGRSLEHVDQQLLGGRRRAVAGARSITLLVDLAVRRDRRVCDLAGRAASVADLIELVGRELPAG